MKFVLLAGVLILCGAVGTNAQSCLTPEDVKQMVARIESGQQVKLDKKLNEELVKTAQKQRDLLQEVVAEDLRNKSDQEKLRKLYQKDATRLCEIVKTSGWPNSESVGAPGIAALFQLLRNSPSFELQRDLLPVIVAAIKKDPRQKPEFAALYDRLRVSAGMKQLFGTQGMSRGGFTVLYPIEDEARVDARRAQFGLVDMRQNIRDLQRIYGKAVIKSRQAPATQHSQQLTDSIAKAVDDTAVEPDYVAPNDVIKTETNLVNLNVSVFNNKSNLFVGELKQEDFRVLEDGKEQAVTYFASTDVPFDLVLLIDLSASTVDKRELIKASTLRFIQAARPNDRIAIVTFHSNTNIVSPLTLDRAQLAASVENMPDGGGSRIWDAVKFALDNVLGPKTPERRRAIVLMSDGVDGALSRTSFPTGSAIPFADLVEQVRQTDVLIVPIYLDTEETVRNPFYVGEYENARRTLNLLAQESGGSYYKARKLEDLNGVYEQVINDLGKVYSLGYKPSNPTRDGGWRSVQISIANRPDLVTRARPGYYAQ